MLIVISVFSQSVSLLSIFFQQQTEPAKVRLQRVRERHLSARYPVQTTGVFTAYVCDIT